jgi:hypothetical protein
MNWLTFSTSLTPIGVIELHIGSKYWEEVRLKLTRQIYYLTSSSGLDLVLTDYDAWSFLRFWKYMFPFYWHKCFFIWSYETSVLSHRTLNFVDTKLSHRTLIFIDRNWVVRTPACWCTQPWKYTWYVFVCYDEKMNMYGKYHMCNGWIWSCYNIWLEGNMTKDFFMIKEEWLGLDPLLEEVTRQVE